MAGPDMATPGLWDVSNDLCTETQNTLIRLMNATEPAAERGQGSRGPDH